ncbi:MAG: hypothetical protein CVT59_07965 [Actinobacteria bacterium HGW-Actinobacteria-1]|jgi:hypothetical protein|nr:MAG: hypothetical protein CVT59_07965 [Actinobacteria bacterium HGW-Actinobacteria-1]
MSYEPRTYRSIIDVPGLVTFEVVHAETDLQISATRDLTPQAETLVRELRAGLEAYIAANPRFAESHVPIEVGPGAPRLAREMADAARITGVGPMASVAGAFAEAVAVGLSASSAEVIVENGGDLFVMGGHDRTVLLWAGDSPLSGRVALIVSAAMQPVAVCTSSARVGPSLSYGSAHAVTILAENGALADAAASAVGNVVHAPDDIALGLERAKSIPGVLGAVIIADDRIGATGLAQLAPVQGG